MFLIFIEKVKKKWVSLECHEWKDEFAIKLLENEIQVSV